MTYKTSKYFITSSKKKIKYLFIKKNSQITVVFFHGFMSDMVGAKPKAVQKFCSKKKLNFLKFEYSGHGKSSGRFIDGNISLWTKEAKELISSKLKKKTKLIFIGSSMGSWIALNLFPFFKKNIKGFIGIGSAPDFLENLMWKKFTKKIKKFIIDNNVYNLEHGDFTYPLTKQLIFDGRNNKILNKKNYINIPITLLHGSKDNVVPLKYSKKILGIFSKSDKKFIVVKNGHHSLSRIIDLKKICYQLSLMIKKISTV